MITPVKMDKDELGRFLGWLVMEERGQRVVFSFQRDDGSYIDLSTYRQVAVLRYGPQHRVWERFWFDVPESDDPVWGAALPATVVGGWLLPQLDRLRCRPDLHSIVLGR